MLRAGVALTVHSGLATDLAGGVTTLFECNDGRVLVT
jgi:hypothetical protein